MRGVLLKVAVAVSATILALVAAEIAIRIYHSYKYGSRAGRPAPEPLRLLVSDDELGWVPAPRLSIRADRRDAEGRTYRVVVNADERGFRMFGDPAARGRRRIIFLGDSFTHAIEVSDDKTYFSLLREAFDIEVFALGVGGYGTLQEHLMLNRFVDEIRPDAVVLQFCSNDFINNDLSAESLSTINNNGRRRPYLTPDGGIMYAVPKRHAALRELIAKNSRFLYFVLNRIDRLNARRHSVESDIARQGSSHPVFRRAASVTERILRMMRSRTPAGTPIYVFSVDHDEPYYGELERIAGECGMIFIGGVSQAVEAAERDGIVTRVADRAHWSEEGHRIAAAALSGYFGDDWN